MATRGLMTNCGNVKLICYFAFEYVVYDANMHDLLVYTINM